ncbi:MAG: RluA family pseudouridine synthase [Candidatus Omnitrophica bacterium]|nr:RluA family pseudouridine synthase [Candidatus Omnitrophota bacterium]
MENENIEIRVHGEGAGKRLDVFLAEAYPKQTSRSHIKKLIDEGCVLINGAPAKPNHKLKEGEIITVNPSGETVIGDLKPENIPLEVLYEDEHLLVVNKPAGMASHPAAGISTGTLVSALLYHCKTLSAEGPKDRPGIVHRLDKDTSGLMVVAKDDETHRKLAEQFKERQVAKKYIAFVKGLVELDEGKIELPIGRHPTQRQKQAVRFGESREAVTEYKVVKRFPGSNAAMVELTPRTGRMHQLRVHLAYIGHPILGDSVYGAKSSLISRQALHAFRLGFRHPATGKFLEFSAELPADMQILEKKLAIL